MDRKTFIKKTSAGILMAFPAYMMLGCSSSDDGGDGPGPNPNPDPDPVATDCIENGTDTDISANHGHTLTVSKEDVSAGIEKSYTLSEASTDQHIHTVTLTASQFTSLKNNNSITATSTSNGGHTHNVTVSCA